MHLTKKSHREMSQEFGTLCIVHRVFLVSQYLFLEKLNYCFFWYIRFLLKGVKVVVFST